MRTQHLRDTRLSLKAIGLFSIILSLPPEWDFSIAGLAAITKDGIATVRAALNELERKWGDLFSSIFRTITVDNGSEFSDCEGMETSIFGGQRRKMY